MMNGFLGMAGQLSESPMLCCHRQYLRLLHVISRSWLLHWLLRPHLLLLLLPTPHTFYVLSGLLLFLTTFISIWTVHAPPPPPRGARGGGGGGGGVVVGVGGVGLGGGGVGCGV